MPQNEPVEQNERRQIKCPGKKIYAGGYPNRQNKRHGKRNGIALRRAILTADIGEKHSADGIFQREIDAVYVFSQADRLKRIIEHTGQLQ